MEKIGSFNTHSDHFEWFQLYFRLKKYLVSWEDVGFGIYVIGVIRVPTQAIGETEEKFNERLED